MPNAWDDLPNAKHIDRVRAHFKKHPQRWYAALDSSWDAARNLAWDAARDLVRCKYRSDAWSATFPQTYDISKAAASAAARVLIAWDDCAYILDLPPDAVRMLAGSGNHAAVLLYPAVQAMYEGDK